MVIQRWRVAARMLLAVGFLFVFVGMANALPQAPGSDGIQTSPTKMPDFRQRLVEAQNELLHDLLRPAQDKGVIAARFFAFHARHSLDLQRDLERRIAEQDVPASIAEQRDLAVQMDYFASTVIRYDLLASLHRATIVREEQTYAAMDNFPKTDDVFNTLRALRDQAEQYREVLLQHSRASQMAQDLEDLSSLTKHRFYRVAEYIPHN